MKWDDHALRLSIIDADESTQSDIVHWIQKFPFPMNHRDYLYVRRYCLDTSIMASPKIVIKCHSIHHPDVPDEKKCVRVNKYQSSMIIQSKTRLEEVRWTTKRFFSMSLALSLERIEISLDLSWRCEIVDANIDLFLLGTEWSVERKIDGLKSTLFFRFQVFQVLLKNFIVLRRSFQNVR